MTSSLLNRATMGREASEEYVRASSRPEQHTKPDETRGLLDEPEDADEPDTDDDLEQVLGQQLESANSTGSDLLFSCTEVNVLVSLLQKRVPLDGRSSEGLSLLHHAALHNRRSVVTYLFEHGPDLGLDLSETDNHGCNCLFYCVRGSGGVDLLGTATAAGLRFTPSTAAVTVLMEAALKGRLDLVRYLCVHGPRNGLDTRASDRNGWNALMYAASSGHVDVFEALVLYGVDWRHLANDGRTTLMQAAFGGHVLLMEYILAQETQLALTLDRHDYAGYRAIDYAVQGWTEITILCQLLCFVGLLCPEVLYDICTRGDRKRHWLPFKRAAVLKAIYRKLSWAEAIRALYNCIHWFGIDMHGMM